MGGNNGEAHALEHCELPVRVYGAEWSRLPVAACPKTSQRAERFLAEIAGDFSQHKAIVNITSSARAHAESVGNGAMVVAPPPGVMAAGTARPPGSVMLPSAVVSVSPWAPSVSVMAMV